MTETATIAVAHAFAAWLHAAATRAMIAGMRAMRLPSNGWWRQVLLYGGLLAIGTALLQWLDYSWLMRAHSTEFYLLLVAGGFLMLGLLIGARVMGTAAPPRPIGNPAAQASLGISDREMTVLRELAAGHANKQIARNLDISPNTVKTHVARLFEKLGARRRTDALARARELGLLP